MPSVLKISVRKSSQPDPRRTAREGWERLCGRCWQGLPPGGVGKLGVAAPAQQEIHQVLEARPQAVSVPRYLQHSGFFSLKPSHFILFVAV